MNKGLTIAIDGPAGSGKGTIARLLIDRLHGVTFHTGAMYRALAYVCVINGIALDDEESVLATLAKNPITLRDSTGLGSYTNAYVNGINVTDKIHVPDIAKAASHVSQLQKVREIFVKEQRRLAVRLKNIGKIVVMEGYDIGSVVLPNADIKFFLTASVEARAERRMKQYKKNGIDRPLEEIIEEIKLRDDFDMNRKHSPLPRKPRTDKYVVIDSSRMTEGETMNAIMHELRKKNLTQL